MNKSLLKKLVISEADKLKKNATKRELSKLNIDDLRSTNALFCIYGQMTGSCYTTRAHNLISKCATRVYKQKTGFTDAVLKGNPIPNMFKGKYYHRELFSPIECFIAFQKNRENGNNESLVNYLKGITDKLILKKF